MATARAHLHVVEAAPDVVPVPTSLLVDALENAAAIAADLDDGLEAIALRLFAGNRAAAFNELGRMSVRVDAYREAFAALDPDPTHPRRPHRVA